MSKFKKALKAVSGLVNDVVPNEIKPIVKVGLALIPGVGPALSAAYTAVDAYGGGASLGNALGQGAKSYAISQVAGAASRSLGLSTQGNDLTDALGQTKGEGILGLNGASSQAAATLGTTTAASAAGSASTSGAADGLSAADKAFIASAKTSASAASTASAAAAAAAPASSSLFTFDNLSKGAALAGGVATAASMLTKPDVPTAANNNNSSATISDDAAVAAAEEERRKRRGSSSNIYTSPLGISNGQGAAAQLLG